jgi:hypothetical protein
MQVVATDHDIEKLPMAAHHHHEEGGHHETADAHHEADHDHDEGLMRVYAGPLNHLKAVRRGECPMYPSCSQYSRQAVARHGIVKGWMMTMDRLMRCGRDETRRAPRILINGKWKYYDPVENNTGLSLRREKKLDTLVAM